MKLIYCTESLGLILGKIRNLSTPASFSKGRSYYYNGNVGTIIKNNDIFGGKVRGTKYYNVTLKVMVKL